MSARVDVLDKTFAILAIIGKSGPCSLPQVAQTLDLPFSTVHRLVGSLCDNGFVIRHGRGRYRLGLAIVDLAANTSLTDILASVGRPVIAGLARRYRCSAHLGILDGDMVTYLVKEAGGSSLVFSSEGLQLEAYCSAIGKVLVAYLPATERRAYLRAGTFIALTGSTIVDAAALDTELDKTRNRGWAIDNEESLQGLRCLAVPIFDGAGEVRAAISISGATSHLQKKRISGIITGLRHAAQILAGRLYATPAG